MRRLLRGGNNNNKDDKDVLHKAKTKNPLQDKLRSLIKRYGISPVRDALRQLEEEEEKEHATDASPSGPTTTTTTTTVAKLQQTPNQRLTTTPPTRDDGNNNNNKATTVPVNPPVPLQIAYDIVDVCSDAMMVTDGHGTVTMANPAARTLFGYDPPKTNNNNNNDDMVGIPLSRLLPAKAVPNQPQSTVQHRPTSLQVNLSVPHKDRPVSSGPPLHPQLQQPADDNDDNDNDDNDNDDDDDDSVVVVGRTRHGTDLSLRARIHWIRQTPNAWLVVCHPQRRPENHHHRATAPTNATEIDTGHATEPPLPLPQPDHETLSEHELVQSVLESSFDAIVVVDEDGTIVRPNAAFCSTFGFATPLEAQGQNIAQCVGGDPRHRAHHRDYLRRFHERGGTSTTIVGKRRRLMARRKDGSEFPCKIGVKKVLNSRFMVGFIQDISNEIKAAENERLNQSILDSSFHAIIVTDLEGVIVKVTAATLNIFGFESSEQVVGKNIAMLVGGNEGHAQRHATYMQRFRERRGTSTLLDKKRKLRARRHDGSEFPCRIGVRRVVDSELLVGFVEDVTHEEEAEQGAQLNQSILDSSFDAIVVIGRDNGKMVKVNASLLEHFGFQSVDEVVGKDFSMLLTAEDGSSTGHWMDRLMKPDGDKSALGRKIDSIAQRKDGTKFPCHVDLRRVAGSELLVAFIQDITQEKEAQREHSINQSILDSSFDAIVVADEVGNIMKVNASFLTTFQFGAVEEVKGKNLSMLVGGNRGDAEKHAMYMKRFKERGGSSILLGNRRQVVARRRDGSEFPCRIGIRKVKGTDLLVGFIQDISTELRSLELAVEKRAAEDLLFNMLPEEIAHRLKHDPGHIADSFRKATVLFGDIVGFTKMSNSLSPVQVVEFLNSIFSRFDETLDRYGLNKVKTIGDCYMVTSVPGCRNPPKTCTAVCHFAMDMIEALEEYNKEHADAPLHMRIGINIGPVVAGVVGTKRFLYDIWGDAVNVASRMESTGIAGRVQVTRAVVETVNSFASEEIHFTKRGMVKVKGIGEMETYLIDKRDPGLTSTYWTLSSEDSILDKNAMAANSGVELLRSVNELDELERQEGKTEMDESDCPNTDSTLLRNVKQVELLPGTEADQLYFL